MSTTVLATTTPAAATAEVQDCQLCKITSHLGLRDVADHRISRIIEEVGGLRPEQEQPTFHPFSRFPFDIRFLIWQYAVDPPHINRPYPSFKERMRSWLPPNCVLRDGGLWRACKESRAVISQVYHRDHRHGDRDIAGLIQEAKKKHWDKNIVIEAAFLAVASAPV